ncbi:MAG TPA: SDR family oxidoreductase [Herpetosiphonaceae bacterium]
MTGSVALVTGSSSGIGRQIAEALARQGHAVYATMRGVDGKNRAVADELRALAAEEGLSLHPVELDVTDQASVDRAVAAVIEQAGGIDVVVHNAGMGLAGLTEASTLTQVEHLFSTNAFGLLRVNQAVLPHMRARGAGHLVYISSISGELYVPFYGLYGASKGAFEAFAEATHYEVYSLGIDTTIMQLGGYNSNFGANLQLSDRVDTLDSYGDMGQTARTAQESASSQLSYAEAPAKAAEQVAAVVALPAGQRPLRILTGAFTEPLQGIAETRAERQATFFTMMNLEKMITRG